jgi:hypothetical protein
MPKLDAQSRKRLFSYLYEAFDDDNAADMETFAQNFLHNADAWDAIADHFPDAAVSEVKAVMMEAYTAWQQGQEPPPADKLH